MCNCIEQVTKDTLKYILDNSVAEDNGFEIEPLKEYDGDGIENVSLMLWRDKSAAPQQLYTRFAFRFSTIKKDNTRTNPKKIFKNLLFTFCPFCGIEYNPSKMVEYTYGAMSTKWSLKAANKLTAYATMVCQYNESAHMVTIYTPEENREDRWLNLLGQISERLDEIFGGAGSFDKYCEDHREEIQACHDSIEKIV